MPQHPSEKFIANLSFQLVFEARPARSAVSRTRTRSLLHQLTRRAVIYYGTAFLESRSVPRFDLQINFGDMQGLMACVSNIEERELNLILLSPGDTADAAESMVDPALHNTP